MKLAVCIKEVLDARLPLQVSPQTGELAQPGGGAVTLINPADRAALEVALQLRSQSPGSRVEAFSVCDAGEEGALRFALARGADAAERLAPQHRGSPYTALALASRLAGADYDLIFCGDETLDNASAMVGPLLAELLDLPQVTSVSALRQWNGSALMVERSLDRGHRELVELELPGLVTFKAEAAEPQYVSVRRLEQARSKEIPVRHLDLPLAAAPGPVKWPDAEKRVPPRARVKKKFMPDAKLSAAERVKLIMAGGAASQPSSQSQAVLEGDADYLSEQLFRFLRHHEFV